MDSEKIKEFTHKDVEICKLCGKSIEMEIDRWNVILEYYPREISKGFYHQKCLNDLIKEKGEVIKQNFMNKLQDYSRGILKNALSMRNTPGMSYNLN